MHFIPRSLVNISDTVFGTPRSASSSHTVSRRSLLIAPHTSSTFSGVLLVGGLPEHGYISTDSWSPFKDLCHTFICAEHVASSPKAIWIVSMEGWLSLLQIWCRFIALLAQSFWMWGLHSTHAHSMGLPPLLTSTAKPSLFTREHPVRPP